MTTSDSTVAHLRETLQATLDPLLPRGEPYALLGYPAYANVGDSAIWLGAQALLHACGAGRPSYACTTKTFDAEALRQRVPHGTILLTGGGNFGDLYPSHQRMREDVVRAFPAHRIVQLPQTVHYTSDLAMAESRRVLAGHKDFTLLVRDEPSLELAREGLGVRAVACPDLAFALGPQSARRAPTHDVIWLLRDDQESRFPASAPRARGNRAGVTSQDWPLESRHGLFALQRRLRKAVARAPGRRRKQGTLLQRTFGPVARARLRTGLDLLASGRTVITDRLHGHILCVLLGLPHVLLDNSYGKNRAFHDRWTANLPWVRWAASRGDVARELEALAEQAR